MGEASDLHKILDLMVIKACTLGQCPTHSLHQATKSWRFNGQGFSGCEGGKDSVLEKSAEPEVWAGQNRKSGSGWSADGRFPGEVPGRGCWRPSDEVRNWVPGAEVLRGRRDQAGGAVPA